ncbi:MAG: hypothetical protein FJX70_07315 [Alphaproteobacteria bacterium]|nr:hypothetical protein [Alphaproteobacteria bacterium]
MIKAAFLVPLFNTFKNNPVTGFWFVFIIFMTYVGHKIFLSLTNKNRGYSILFTFIYLCFLQIILNNEINIFRLIGYFIRYVLIFSTIFFIIQNNYSIKNLISLSLISIIPGIVLTLIATYYVCSTTPIEQEFVGVFPDVNNYGDFYLYLIKNNLFFPFINELLVTSTLIESLSVIIPILFDLIGSVIMCLGFYYWATHILFKEEEQKVN